MLLCLPNPPTPTVIYFLLLSLFFVCKTAYTDCQSTLSGKLCVRGGYTAVDLTQHRISPQCGIPRAIGARRAHIHNISSKTVFLGENVDIEVEHAEFTIHPASTRFTEALFHNIIAHVGRQTTEGFSKLNAHARVHVFVLTYQKSVEHRTWRLCVRQETYSPLPLSERPVSTTTVDNRE